MAGNGGVNGSISMLQYGGGGFGQKAGDGRKGRLGRVLVRSDVEVWSSSDFTCLEGRLFLIDLPIKISPKMVFAFVTDLLGRENLNASI